MKIVKYILLIFLIFNNITTYAQKVSNVTFRQEQSNIIVSYDLETKTPCKISLFVSIDDGKTWKGPLKKVSGDAGAKIATGNHNITWNVLEEFEELRGDKIKFQVRALEDDNDDTSIYNTTGIKVKPDFPGGLEKFYKFISENYKVPEEEDLKGKIFVTFVVEKDGSLSDIKVLRDIGYGTGKEAIRVLKTCPRWVPGELNGKKVRVLYSLPISIGSVE